MTFNPNAKPEARVKAIRGLIADLSKDHHPILLGPFRSELGFEASYWLPFLTWLSKQIKGFDQRACVLTRGGLAPLYANVASRGYDLYALRSVTEVRRENLFDHKTSGLLKQSQITEWDEAVLVDAAEALGLGALYHVVHPAWMYWGLAPFWEEQVGLRYVSGLTDFAPLPKPVVQGSLPPKYVAMKWYARATFPYPEPSVAEFVQHVTATVASRCPVVLLTSTSDHDDHVDIPIVGPQVHTLPTDVPPEENLLIQAAVLAHASAFVGTYGGVAQLALRFGVPSCSFYAQWGGTMHAHLSLSSAISKQMGIPFTVGSLQDALFWSQTVGQLVKAPQAVAA